MWDWLRRSQEIKEGAVSWRLEEKFLEKVTAKVKCSRGIPINQLYGTHWV